jgi:hypothetical protein
MHIIFTPPKVEKISTLNDIWFQHHSPLFLKEIIPQTYSVISKHRNKSYMTSRITEENNYKSLLQITDKNISFTYATIVKFNKMESAKDYPGFTYYFRLRSQQVENTLFGIISGGKTDSPPEKGVTSLKKCLLTWNEEKNNYSSYHEENTGLIDPRIEVIIPYSITPELFFPEEELR